VGVVCLVAIVLFTLRPAGAQVGGGGADETDCFAAFQSIPAPNAPVGRPSGVACADQDGTCGDANPSLGYCGFSVGVIFNSTSFASCTPTDLPADGFLIPYSGAANDDHPKHVAGFEPLQIFAENNLPLTPVDTNVASGMSSVTVPLDIRFTSKGPKFRKTTITLQPTTCTTPLQNGKCSSGERDGDKFKLVCSPAIDPMTGDPISPCTGISSTFQQIQEHIFDRKCATPACHGSTQSFHDLCLVDSCDAGTRSAHTDLVGVVPHNFAASADGLLRVAAGSPAQSFLLKKVRGELDSPDPMFGKDAYGKRMPYHNPANDRPRKKLGKAEVQLITDWIAAGAPATGFVATTAAGACP